MNTNAARNLASPPVAESRNAMVISVLLHVGFLFILLFGVLLESLERKPREHVFELVSPPSADSMQARADVPAAQAQPMPVDPVTLPEVEPLRESRPRPRVEAPVPQTPPEPVAAPREQAEPRPQPRQISADEFRRRFGQPTASQEVRQPRLEVPKIDTSRIRESLESVVVETSRTSVSSMTRTNQDALGAYVSLIRARIDSVWIRPSGYDGNSQEIVVLFDVAPDGTISRVRLESGNPRDAFVQSVLNAFSRVRSVGPTPTGQEYTFRMPFRMIDPGG